MIARTVGLILVLAATAAIVTAAQGAGDSFRVAGLALGFALVAAVVAGELLERLRLPRVTGYLLFGLLCGPSLANLITRPMARELELLNGLAVTLIAFVAGLELNVARLRPRLGSMLAVGGTTIAVAWVGLFLLLAALWSWLPLAPEVPTSARLAISALVAALLASGSPTVTLAIVAESRAAGPLAELTLAVVILADLVLILLFAGTMALVRWTLGLHADVGLLAGLAWELVGSILAGAGAGALFALYLRHVGRELALAFLAICVLMSLLGRAWALEPLVVALAAGLVVENVAPPEGDAFRRAVERSALPVLVVFFVAAGASLDLAALGAVGALAVGLALARGVLFWAGVRLAGRLSPVGPHARWLWMGLVSQAGVTLGLVGLVAAEHPSWGGTVRAVILALVGLHQLVGPVLFRVALARAGEIGREVLEAAPVAAPARASTASAEP